MALERNKKINPGYFQQVLDISNGLSIQQRQLIQNVINNIKKYNGAVTDKEYELLQRLKTGDFKYGTKNEANFKWTPDLIKQAATLYKSRSEFQKNDSNIYQAALRNNMLDDLFPETAGKQINWTPDLIKQAATLYKSRSEFMKNDRNAYSAALRNNMLDDLFPETADKRTNRTDDEIKQAAAPYKSRSEFKYNDRNAYTAALRRNMMDDLFPETAGKPKPVFRTDDEIKQIAALYKGRREFFDNNPAAYSVALKRGMMDTLFPFKGEYNKVYIYVFKFFDKQGNPTSAYVGLTSNPNVRRKEHETGINRYSKLNTTGVSNYMKTYPDEKYEFDLLTNEPLELSGTTRKELMDSPGAKAEREWVEYFKNNGWKIINKRIGGTDFGPAAKPKNTSI
jgi:hypothetical protein